MNDELILTVRTIPLTDDDMDAACEAAANGLREFTLVECDEPNDPDGTLVLGFRLGPGGCDC